MFRRWSVESRSRSKTKERSSRMPHVIDAEQCTACGACAAVCPSEAIAEGVDAYVIDPEQCNDCDACTVECPVEAISAA
ncbi:MAG: 4Fe-4S binding protein [Armatimonadetes bacterium]|nr:4Fe-4S binding protein [Armatimonadota bacterium]